MYFKKELQKNLKIKIKIKKMRYNSCTIIFSPLNHTIQWFFSIFTKLCNHHHYLIPEHLHYSKRNLIPLSNQSLPVVPPYPLLCLFWTFHVDKIIQYVAFLCLASFT